MASHPDNEADRQRRKLREEGLMSLMEHLGELRSGYLSCWRVLLAGLVLGLFLRRAHLSIPDFYGASPGNRRLSHLLPLGRDWHLHEVCFYHRSCAYSACRVPPAVVVREACAQGKGAEGCSSLRALRPADAADGICVFLFCRFSDGIQFHIQGREESRAAGNVRNRPVPNVHGQYYRSYLSAVRDALAPHVSDGYPDFDSRRIAQDEEAGVLHPDLYRHRSDAAGCRFRFSCCDPADSAV